MGLGGFWWSNVLDLALPPWRLRPDTQLAHQVPASYVAQKKRKRKKKKTKTKRWTDRILGQVVKAYVYRQNHTKKHTYTHSQKEKKENKKICIYIYKRKEESNETNKQIHQ